METQITTKQENIRCKRVSKSEATKPVRLWLQTKKSLDALMKTINLKKTSKKIKYDDIISCAIAKLTDSDIEALRNSMVTNKDRFEELYRIQKKENKSLTKDDFLGELLKAHSQN